MAVYMVRRNNPWGAVGLNLGNGLLGSVLGGMFARDAAARDARRSRQLYGAVADSMTPQQGLPQPEAPRPQYSEDVQSLANSAMRGMPTATEDQGWSGLWNNTVGLGKGNNPGRESLLRGLAKHGATQQEAKGLFDLYTNQFETADKLGYQDNVASRVGGLEYDVRNNPTGAAQSSMMAQAYGLKPEEIFKYTAPNFTSGHFSAGDKEVMYGFDPLKNRFYLQNVDYGINPTNKYQADAATRQANIRAEADRYVADTNLRGDIVSSSAKGNGGGQGGKPLTLSDKKNIGELVFQNLQLADTKDGFNQQAFEQWLNSAFADNPEAMAYARSIVGMPQYEQNNIGMKIPATNPYQPTQQGEELGTITPGQVSGRGQGQTQPQGQGRDLSAIAGQVLQAVNGNKEQAIAAVDSSQGLSPGEKASMKQLIMASSR